MTDPNKELRVLLIDDDEVDTRIIESNLRKCGLEISLDKIVDPEVGKDMAMSGTYSCMLMDFRYPTGNAFELFNDLLKTPCSQRPPVILMTNLGSEGVAAQSIQFGAQEYLSKSEISPWNLRRMIESACEKGEMQRQMEAREQELVRMSFYDSLTGLANRQLFNDRLGHHMRDAARHDQIFALLMMDLDLFKNVNDSYGHTVGDKLLMQVAERLSGSMRESDTIARLGGDEFAAILSSIDEADGSFIVVEKIQHAFDEPFVIDDLAVRCGISIGITVYPDGGDSAEDLLKHADTAMYEAKKSASGIAYFNPASTEVFRHNAMLSQDLKSVIAADELEVHFQPQVSLDGDELVGAEALVRWCHPDEGYIDPERFVPMAERSRLICDLTLQVLEKTLRQCCDWHRRGIDLSTSVNLSARILSDTCFPAKVLAILDRYQLPRHKLCLEVTETAIMNSPQMAENILSSLSDCSIRIAIDDFGTGYSSLKYLRQFPIDEIKIDRVFVRNLDAGGADRKIVNSVVALGRSLDMRVVAEGVESAAAMDALRQLGCDVAQGYYICEPLPPAGFDAWLEGRDGGGQTVEQVSQGNARNVTHTTSLPRISGGQRPY